MVKKDIFASYDFEYSLLGLRMTAPSYKVAWILNKHLGINLALDTDLSIYDKKNGTILYLQYLYSTENTLFRLIKNKNVENEANNILFLLPDFKHMDFILQISGDIYPLTIKDIHVKLRKINNIELINEIPTDKLQTRIKDILIL